jgi:hypothetical protein
LNADKIKNAGVPTQLMLGSAIVFFIFGFFDWYSVSVSGVAGFGGASWSGNAFEYFPGTLSWILMIGVAVVALLMLVRGPDRNLIYGVLGGSALSVLLVLWYWAASAGKDIPNISGIDSGASFGLYICLLAAIVSTVGAVMMFQAFQKQGTAA